MAAKPPIGPAGPDTSQDARIRLEHAGSEAGGEFVLYWMATALRAGENPALETAIGFAAERGLPLLVYQGLFAQGWYCSDRTVAFVLEGTEELQKALAARGVRHVLDLRRPLGADSMGNLLRLAARSAVVVAEDFPCGPLPRWRHRIAETSGRPVYAVDTACVLPMNLVGRAFERAYSFRNSTRVLRNQWVGQEVPKAGPVPAWDGDPGFEPAAVDGWDISHLLASMEIDHAVGRVHETPGGSSAARARWDKFLKNRLKDYHVRRNDAADIGGVSGMSPYLHFGVISPWELAREARDVGGEGAEKFIEELLEWRELAYCFCRFAPVHDTLEALPAWARNTLLERTSMRDDRPTLDQIERGRTGDALFDLCQRSLIRHGELHNNVRMTWGKAIASWFADPGEGLQLAIDLNHRYALDGRDPSSYGGILWCFGLFDGPKTPVDRKLGLVRSRGTANHLRRLGEDAYTSVVMRPRGGIHTALVVGAGASGLLAAQTLADHGLDVTVLDKARGVGGRLATRRFGGGVFDHGAQFFTTRDPRFARHVLRWADAGVVTRWCLGFPGNEGHEGMDGHTRFRGSKGMTSLPKHLADDLNLFLETRVERIRRVPEGWLAVDGAGREWRAETLLLTPPVPQSLALLDAGEVQLDRHLRDDLDSLAYHPCLAALLVLDGPSRVPEPGGIALHDGPVSWIADNTAKGISPDAHAVTVHASPEFSAAHYETPEAEVAALLIDHAKPHLGSPVVSSEIRRWKYAQPVRPYPAAVAFESGAMPVVFAGDAFGGARVEGAALSGIAAAGYVLSLHP